MATREPEKHQEDLLADVIRLDGGSIQQVEAEIVNIHQGGANRISADSVEIKQGAAIVVDAGSILMQQSATGFAQGSTIIIEDGSAAAVYGQDIQVNTSRIGLMASRHANLQNSRSVILLAGEIHGNVETVMDTRQAVLAGLISGMAVGLVLFVGSLLRRR
jgi:hypothetical protein